MDLNEENQIFSYYISNLEKWVLFENLQFLESARKEPKKKVHEEVIAEDYDSTKEDISQIDLSQQFMVCKCIYIILF